jgi:hypothetical protein
MTISWKYLKQFHFNPPNILIPRKEKVQKKYDIHKEKIGMSIDNYILDTILHNLRYKITINRFPYDLEKNISHHILWIFPNHIILKKDIENIINTFFGYKKFICYKNKIEARSIKTIEHYHIFIFQNM